MKRLPVFNISIVALFLACGCAATSFRVGDEWDPKETPFFDDGVDVVEDISTLSGKWAYRHEKETDGRMQLADFVGVVNILSVQTKSDFNVEAAKRIDVEVVETIYGNTPAGIIQLLSTREAPGHQLLLRYEQRLSGKRLVFIRWFKQEDKTIGHHFHISPASEYLVPKVRAAMDMRKRKEAASH